MPTTLLRNAAMKVAFEARRTPPLGLSFLTAREADADYYRVHSATFARHQIAKIATPSTT